MISNRMCIGWKEQWWSLKYDETKKMVILYWSGFRKWDDKLMRRSTEWLSILKMVNKRNIFLKCLSVSINFKPTNAHDPSIILITCFIVSSFYCENACSLIIWQLFANVSWIPLAVNIKLNILTRFSKHMYTF